MKPSRTCILTINGGSSSIKFALYQTGEPPERKLYGASIRARVCGGLGFLGIELNESRNAETAGVISTDASRATVRVIRTDEELMVARSVWRVERTAIEVKAPPTAGLAIEGATE